MFSFLKPSSTVSIMKRIARVCQSMLLSVSTPGFERKSDRHAIKTDIVSISSFFSRQSIFLIVDPPAPMICMQRKCRRSNPAQRVRFGKEKQHHRSIVYRLRRRMTSWCCFDVVDLGGPNKNLWCFAGGFLLSIEIKSSIPSFPRQSNH